LAQDDRTCFYGRQALRAKHAMTTIPLIQTVLPYVPPLLTIPLAQFILLQTVLLCSLSRRLSSSY